MPLRAVWDRDARPGAGRQFRLVIGFVVGLALARARVTPAWCMPRARLVIDLVHA